MSRSTPQTDQFLRPESQNWGGSRTCHSGNAESSLAGTGSPSQHVQSYKRHTRLNYITVQRFKSQPLVVCNKFPFTLLRLMQMAFKIPSVFPSTLYFSFILMFIYCRGKSTVGGEGLQIWRVSANIFNKQSRTADKGWPSSLGGWAGG
jgi:hypothetical protein